MNTDEGALLSAKLPDEVEHEDGDHGVIEIGEVALEGSDPDVLENGDPNNGCPAAVSRPAAEMKGTTGCRSRCSTEDEYSDEYS